ARQGFVEVVPRGGRVAGAAAGSAVVQGAQPRLDVVTNGRGKPGELAVQPVVEGRASVLDEDSHLGEHFTDAFGAGPEPLADREHLRGGDRVAGDMIG